MIAVSVLLLVMYRIMRPIEDILDGEAAIATAAGAVSQNLQAVPNLVQTQQLVGTVREGVGAYGAAITRLL
ncbi:MAG: hypothetical protein ACRDZ8_13980 [Acidimicrobiales bacterium]